MKTLITQSLTIMHFNPLVGILKPHLNGSLYSNTVIGTLAVNGWAVTFGTARRGLGGLRPRRVLSSLPNVTAHLSKASVPTSCYSKWHYNYLCPLKVKSNLAMDKFLYVAFQSKRQRIGEHRQERQPNF